MTLRLRLMLSVGAVVLASLAAVFFGTTRIVRVQLSKLTHADAPSAPRTEPIAEALREHHRAQGWRNVQPLLARLRDRHAPGRELLLFDEKGPLIAASSLPPGGLDVHQRSGKLTLSYRIDGNPVRVMIAGLVVDVGGASVHFVPKWQSRTLATARTVNRWLLLIVAVTGIAALLSTALVARRILGPVEQLQAAVQRVEGGELGQQVPVTSRDEVGKLAGAFNAMSAQLARDETLRRNMVNDVAHELRTPLTNLICAVEAIQDGLRKPDGAAIESLHDDLLLLQRLVDDLQTLALAEAGKLPLHVEPLDLREELERAVRSLRDARVTIDAQPGAVIHADRMRFQQIVTNLLHNAIAHSGSDGRITVSARASPERVEVVVADDGRGIEAEHLPHVFDRFYRADASRDRATGGAGLGLAIVKNLVELHGGRIEVRSESGRGAAFHIHFPAKN